MSRQGFSYRFRSWLSDRIRPEGAPVPAARRPTAPKPAVRPTAPDERVAFEQALRALIGQAPSAVAGRINVIGLARIKEKFGARWERIAERADRIARNVIAKRLAPGDIYCAWEDDGYLLVFATLSTDEARLKCLVLADEIAKALLGLGEPSDLRLKIAVARIDAELRLHDIQAIDEIAPRAAAIGEVAANGAVMSGAGAALQADPAQGERSGEPAEAEPRFCYRPVWDTARGAIATYRCIATMPAAQSAPPASLDGSDTALIRLDRAAQRRVLHDLDALLRQDKRVLLMVPVHYETLASWPRRQDYVAQLEQLSAARQQLIVVEILRMPDGMPQGRMAELVAPLRRYCRAVAVRVPFAAADFAPIKLAGAIAIGCDIDELDLTEYAVIHEMGPFQRAAEKAGLASFIRGIGTRSLAAAALATGFTYVAGDAVAETAPFPATAVKYNILDIYRPLFDGTPTDAALADWADRGRSQQ